LRHGVTKGRSGFFMPKAKSTESAQAKGARTKRLRRGEAAPSPRLRVTGAPKGPQRAGVAAKEALLSAFDRLGGVNGLVKWGKQNPTEFYRIWARLLPREDSLAVTAVGVEDLLRELDAADAASSERLDAFNQAGELLGLEPPSLGDNVVRLADREAE
jgi:hypothetical protein